LDQTTIEHRGGRGVERDRVRTSTETNGAVGSVKVVDAELAQFGAGGRVQQRHHANERLVRVDIALESPTTEHVTLFAEAEGLAGEATA
jgi:hypothetical protein